MLVYGTCNPEGYGDASYEGLYLTDSDIREITPTMAGVPVKIEHRGVDVGKVITAWVHEGRMDVLMELEDTHIEGAFGKEFVARGLCPELSLGYNVTMSKSPAGFLRASNKKVVELSLVRQGAREGCKIRAFTAGGANHNSSNKRPRTSASASAGAAPGQVAGVPPASGAKVTPGVVAAASSSSAMMARERIHRILV